MKRAFFKENLLSRPVWDWGETFTDKDIVSDERKMISKTFRNILFSSRLCSPILSTKSHK